jgi:DNA-binding XRE family transcriptional regulator
MPESEYKPVPHDQEEFLRRSRETCPGFSEAYDALEDKYKLIRELFDARTRVGLTQEEVATRMGTTKSAVCRLEGSGKHSPSLATLKKYANAVGCDLEIRFVPRSSES